MADTGIDAKPVCRWGGTAAPADALQLTWVENGHRRLYCERCAREHVRAIEDKLDSAWW